MDRALAPATTMTRHRLAGFLPAAVSLIVFAAAVAVLRDEVRSVPWQALQAAALATPWPRLAAALALTAINYAVLTGYDLLAFAIVGDGPPRWRIAGAAFLAYAISSTVGFAALSGASVRYRFYARWGVSPATMARVVVSYSVTFWIGLIALGGVSLAAGALPAAPWLPGPVFTRLIGGLLVAVALGYIAAAALRRAPIRVGGWEMPLPRPAHAILQLVISVADWILAGTILYLLLPSQPPFLGFLAAFLAAMIAGVASHVPGGLGVFDGLLVLGLRPPGRLDLLDRLLPLGIIETSHFLGSIAGAGLLVLSHGLYRRLDAAYYASSILIVVGMGASLLKGADVEEAALLLVVLAALRYARPAFDRRAAFFETRFSARWIAALAAAVAASIWLGRFAFQHVDYAHDLWWRFELSGEASRSLRASVGAAVAVLLVGVARLVGHPRHEVVLPDDAALAEAAVIVGAHPGTAANLVFLRDKALILDDAHQGFVMYGVQGRTWVAMGDPVGPPAIRRTLIRRFLERVDDFGGTPVFYEVGHEALHHYADFGLTFVKLGEEALVDLPSFTLEGSAGARPRQTLRRLERDGGTFRLLAPADVATHLPALRRVSDDWLAAKAAAEKGFSLGFFDEAYVRRFPAGVIERDGAIQAFATIWPGACGTELSVDLMRFAGDAPKNVMEALLVSVMLWGRDAGYRRFSLGMAPLSGFERSPVAPRWQRVGAFVYEHGEAFYGFQGLRAFKEKFVPTWEPRYLACPGGLALPRVLADVSALVAGGYRRIFVK